MVRIGFYFILLIFKVEIILHLDSVAEQDRLISQAQQQLSTEEAMAAEEEAFNLLAQQQTSQDLSYITVPAISSQQPQVC